MPPPAGGGRERTASDARSRGRRLLSARRADLREIARGFEAAGHRRRAALVVDRVPRASPAPGPRTAPGHRDDAPRARWLRLPRPGLASASAAAAPPPATRARRARRSPSRPDRGSSSSRCSSSSSSRCRWMPVISPRRSSGGAVVAGVRAWSSKCVQNWKYAEGRPAMGASVPQLA